MANEKEVIRKIMFECSLTDVWKESVNECLSEGVIVIELDRTSDDMTKRTGHPLKVAALLEGEKQEKNNCYRLDIYQEWLDEIDMIDEQSQQEVAGQFVTILSDAIKGLQKRYSI